MSTTTHTTDTQNPPAPTPNLPFRGDPSAAGREALPETGRAVSARNATTHGLFARDVVLPTLGEDPAAFDALLVQLCTQLPPRNILERHYLEQIAAASWRLRRLHRWQSQVYEDPAIDEDARMDKLDKTLRHETMLTRQIDKAVRLLHRDLSELFADRAREDTLAKLGRTEAECRTSPGLAAQTERIARRAVQATADEPPLIDGLDPDQLDNVHAPPPHKNCENENSQNENCWNEPPEAASSETIAAHRYAPTSEEAPTAAQKCQNENCRNEPAAHGSGITPHPPILGEASMPDGITAYRLAERGPQHSGEVGHGFLTGQQDPRSKNVKTNQSRSH